MRWVIWLGVLGLLAACGAPAAPGPAAPAAAPPAEGSAVQAPQAAAPAVATAPPRLERARIAYGAPSGAFAALWMAKEAGPFAKYGLDAELTYLSSSPTMIASMLAGELDFNELAAPARCRSKRTTTTASYAS
jgi:ABC-type nitrate/sulfonate/bicarbonate transport system substrate-binding protein